MRNTVRWGFECTFSIYISSARVSTITIQSKVEMLIGWVVGNLVLFRRFSVYSFSGLSKERGLKNEGILYFHFLDSAVSSIHGTHVLQVALN